jgi:hypothetical protein
MSPLSVSAWDSRAPPSPAGRRGCWRRAARQGRGHAPGPHCQACEPIGLDGAPLSGFRRDAEPDAEVLVSQPPPVHGRPVARPPCVILAVEGQAESVNEKLTTSALAGRSRMDRVPQSYPLLDPPPIGGRASTLPQHHALLGQLLLRMLVLREMRQTHTTQYIGSLGVLNVVVADDLDAVAPGVAKVEEGSISQGNS